MPYNIKNVTISAFDIHATVNPLRNSGVEYYRDEFRFLKDRTAFNTWYGAANSSFTVEGINFRPVGKKKLRKNSFWSAYGNIAQNGANFDCWNLQLPVVCRPVRQIVALNGRTPGVRGTISAECFLSAVGWSTCVRTSLRGGLVKNDLIKQWVRRIFRAGPTHWPR